jgi:hypothetical protein
MTATTAKRFLLSFKTLHERKPVESMSMGHCSLYTNVVNMKEEEEQQKKKCREAGPHR